MSMWAEAQYVIDALQGSSTPVNPTDSAGTAYFKTVGSGGGDC